MDRLKEDLDEFIASSGSSGDSSRGNDDSCESSEDNSCEESSDDSDEENQSSEDNSKKDQDSDDSDEGDESDEDDSCCQVTVPNKDPDGSLNGSASLTRSHPHSNDLTIMLDLRHC